MPVNDRITTTLRYDADLHYEFKRELQRQGHLRGTTKPVAMAEVIEPAIRAWLQQVSDKGQNPPKIKEIAAMEQKRPKIEKKGATARRITGS